MARVEAVPNEFMRIEVVVAQAPRVVAAHAITLPPGSRVASALEVCGLLRDDAGASQAGRLGIWGRLATLETVLRDGDRVELYRPLTVDPKEARRLRYRKQGPKRLAKGGTAAKREPSA